MTLNGHLFDEIIALRRHWDAFVDFWGLICDFLSVEVDSAESLEVFVEYHLESRWLSWAVHANQSYSAALVDGEVDAFDAVPVFAVFEVNVLDKQWFVEDLGLLFDDVCDLQFFVDGILNQDLDTFAFALDLLFAILDFENKKIQPKK